MLIDNEPRAYELGNVNEMPLAASKIAYKGAAIGMDSSGYARPLQAGDLFLGFNEVEVDNSKGSAGDKNVRIKENGSVELSVTGVSSISVGTPVYASDDNTFTLTATDNSKIGHVKRVVAGEICIVKFKAQEV